MGYRHFKSFETSNDLECHTPCFIAVKHFVKQDFSGGAWHHFGHLYIPILVLGGWQ